jgi:hypothetical protein
MKSYVAVQKKILVMVYHLWKKEEMYDPNYKQNIQEKKQELSSLLAFEKGAYVETKISPNKLRLNKVNSEKSQYTSLC